MNRSALVACILGCIFVAGHAAPLVRHARSLSASVPLYQMETPKPWPLTKDATTEEVVPGLEPTDGYAINATTPNLEPLAPLLETIRPVGPIIKGLNSFFNVSERYPTLPGHDLQNKTSLIVLVPNAEALLKLPIQLANSDAFKSNKTSWLNNVPFLKQSMESSKTSKVYEQVYRNMVIQRMVPYQYLNNATKLTTKLGNPVNVIVSPDGKTKYFQSGNYTAKIMVPDYGKPLVPVVVYMLDSFLLPPTFNI